MMPIPKLTPQELTSTRQVLTEKAQMCKELAETLANFFVDLPHMSDETFEKRVMAGLRVFEALTDVLDAAVTEKEMRDKQAETSQPVKPKLRKPKSGPQGTVRPIPPGKKPLNTVAGAFDDSYQAPGAIDPARLEHPIDPVSDFIPGLPGDPDLAPWDVDEDNDDRSRL